MLFQISELLNLVVHDFLAETESGKLRVEISLDIGNNIACQNGVGGRNLGGCIVGLYYGIRILTVDCKPQNIISNGFSICQRRILIKAECILCCSKVVLSGINQRLNIGNPTLILGENAVLGEGGLKKL